MSLKDLLDGASNMELPEELGNPGQRAVEGLPDKTEDSADIVGEEQAEINKVLRALGSKELSKGAKEEVLEIAKEKKIPVPQMGSNGYIRKLTTRHHLIINLHLQGLNNKEIHERTNINRSIITRTLESELAKGIIASFNGDLYRSSEQILDAMKELGMLSIATLQEAMLDADKYSDKISAAKGALEYIIPKAGQKVEHSHTHLVTSDHLEEMRSRLKQVDENIKSIEEAKFEILDQDEQND